MPNQKFLSPSHNRLLDSDPQIKRVNLDNAEIASRRSAEPNAEKGIGSIKHVPSNS